MYLSPSMFKANGVHRRNTSTPLLQQVFVRQRIMVRVEKAEKRGVGRIPGFQLPSLTLLAQAYASQSLTQTSGLRFLTVQKKCSLHFHSDSRVGQLPHIGGRGNLGPAELPRNIRVDEGVFFDLFWETQTILWVLLLLRPSATAGSWISPTNVSLLWSSALTICNSLRDTRAGEDTETWDTEQQRPSRPSPLSPDLYFQD